MKRHYGFFAIVFLVLLRIAVGWHFLYEGLDKVATPPGDRPWSAEGYLRASTGPFAPQFRDLIPDVEGLEALDLDRLKARWRADLDQAIPFYGFDPSQRQAAEDLLKSTEARAEAWFQDPETGPKVQTYRDDVRKLLAEEQTPDLMSYQRERLRERRRQLDGTRRELVAVVDGWTTGLHEGWRNQVANEAQRALGKPSTPWTSLDWVNWTTKWGLVVCGACLLIGLFTPLAALGGATLLALFYFSNPPWPGLPEAPNAEGHYLIVNKNVVEFFACLVLASTPNGLWIGLDALLFGWIGRRRPQPEGEPDPEFVAADARHR